MTNTAKFSPAARAALTNVGTSRQGASLPKGVAPEVTAELMKDGAVSPGGNLTRRGSILRDRIQSEDLDNLF